MSDFKFRKSNSVNKGCKPQQSIYQKEDWIKIKCYSFTQGSLIAFAWTQES